MPKLRVLLVLFFLGFANLTPAAAPRASSEVQEVLLEACYEDAAYDEARLQMNHTKSEKEGERFWARYDHPFFTVERKLVLLVNQSGDKVYEKEIVTRRPQTKEFQSYLRRTFEEARQDIL